MGAEIRAKCDNCNKEFTEKYDSRKTYKCIKGMKEFGHYHDDKFSDHLICDNCNELIEDKAEGLREKYNKMLENELKLTFPSLYES